MCLSVYLCVSVSVSVLALALSHLQAKNQKRKEFAYSFYRGVIYISHLAHLCCSPPFSFPFVVYAICEARRTPKESKWRTMCMGRRRKTEREGRKGEGQGELAPRRILAVSSTLLTSAGVNVSVSYG